jgi:hypothetical protein
MFCLVHRRHLSNVELTPRSSNLLPNYCETSLETSLRSTCLGTINISSFHRQHGIFEQLLFNRDPSFAESIEDTSLLGARSPEKEDWGQKVAPFSSLISLGSHSSVRPTCIALWLSITVTSNRSTAQMSLRTRF